MKNYELSDIKAFLEHKINSLKKEIEMYEYLLALIESNYIRSKEAEFKGDVIEVKHDNKLVAIIYRSKNRIVLKLLPDILPAERILHQIKSQVELLEERAKIEIVRDKKTGCIKEVVIEGLTSNTVREGVCEALKTIILQNYNKT